MIIGDDNQAAVVAAVLTAALLHHQPSATPGEAAELFQRVAEALQSRGVITPVVARRLVSALPVESDKDGRGRS